MGLAGDYMIELEVVPPIGGVGDKVVAVPLVARARRAAASAAQGAWKQQISGVTRAVHKEVAPPPRQLWTISSAMENIILGWCW